MSSTQTYSGDGADDPTVPADGFDAVKDHLDLDGSPPGTTRSLITIGHCYDYLAKYGEATENDLRRTYTPFDGAQEKHGRYDSRRAWWSSVGRPALLSLPGVEESDGGLRFTGVDPSEVGETCPASDLEVSAEVRAEHVIIETEFRQHGAWIDRQRHALLETWGTLQSRSDMSEDELKAELDSYGSIGRVERFWSDTARDVLEALPGVDVTREGGTPDPAEIEVETLQDVLDGLREVGAVDHDVKHEPGKEVWRG